MIVSCLHRKRKFIPRYVIYEPCIYRLLVKRSYIKPRYGYHKIHQHPLIAEPYVSYPVHRICKGIINRRIPFFYSKERVIELHPDSSVSGPDKWRFLVS